MMSIGLAAALLVASVSLTYVFCLRPMRRGRCAVTSSVLAAVPVSREAEIAQLRAEVRTLSRPAAR